MTKRLPGTALLPHSLLISCAVARQDAAPPEGGRNLRPRRRRRSMAIDGNRLQSICRLNRLDPPEGGAQ